MKQKEPALLNVTQVAKLLKISRRTALRRIQEGDIPSTKMPGTTGAYVVRRADLPTDDEQVAS